MCVEQFEDPQFDPERTRREVLDKTGDTFTTKLETNYLEEGENPNFDRLKKEMIVEVQK